jgi:hypothetical protein
VDEVTARHRGSWIDDSLIDDRLEGLAAVLHDVATGENAHRGPLTTTSPSGKPQVA